MLFDLFCPPEGLLLGILLTPDVLQLVVQTDLFAYGHLLLIEHIELIAALLQIMNLRVLKVFSIAHICEFHVQSAQLLLEPSREHDS